MYTVVQHSAMGYKGDTQFARGVESQSVTEREAVRVREAGGVVFPTYSAAEDFAESEMYPPGYMGLIPMASGAFARLKVDGLRVYVPVEQPAGVLT